MHTDNRVAKALNGRWGGQEEVNGAVTICNTFNNKDFIFKNNTKKNDNLFLISECSKKSVA